MCGPIPAIAYSAPARNPGDGGAEPARPRRVRDRDQQPIDEDQPLRPVDPDRPVQIASPRPLPRDIRVAAFVRPDAPEKGQAYDRREECQRRERRVAAGRGAYWLATSRRRNTRYAAATGIEM